MGESWDDPPSLYACPGPPLSLSGAASEVFHLFAPNCRPAKTRHVQKSLWGSLHPTLLAVTQFSSCAESREVLWTKHFYFKCSKGESRKRKWKEWEFWNSEKKWCLWLGVSYHSSFLLFLLLFLFFFCSNYSWLIIKDTKLYGALMPSQVHHVPSIYMWSPKQKLSEPILQGFYRGSIM